MYSPTQRLTHDGRPYVMWEVPDVRRVPEEVLKSVVFVYPTEDAAVHGKGYGGSGFLVGMTETLELPQGDDLMNDPVHAYVVTNAHVAMDCSYVRTSHPARPIIRIDSWTNHPDGDDVAVAHLGIIGVTPMGLGKVIHSSMFVTEDSFVQAQVGPGDQLFMAGRFTGLDERERNEATIRAGILSMGTPIPVKDKEWGGIMQESFFAEVNSKAGYSGSPVYVTIPIEIPPVKASLMYPPRPQFLGLLGMTWGLWRGLVPLLDPATGDPIPEEWVIQENSGIELVIPSWRIMGLLMEDRVVTQRRQFADDMRRKVKILKPDAVATTAQPLPDEPPDLTKG